MHVISPSPHKTHIPRVDKFWKCHVIHFVYTKRESINFALKEIQKATKAKPIEEAIEVPSRM